MQFKLIKDAMEGQKRIVQGVAYRLFAWESELATEAKATKARCVSCGGHDLVPVTSNDKPGQSGSTVKWWCSPCSGFQSWAVDEADYEGLPFCPDGIP